MVPEDAVRRALLLVAFAIVVAALVPARAGAARECRGLQVCVSVVGPWVVVPSGGSPRPQVEYQLACPRRFTIGGLDAELSVRAIDVEFGGRLGSPVNPGVTTTSRAVFRATYSGRPGRVATFRPRLGCIPQSGGNGGIPTARQVFPPGEPTQRRVRQWELRSGLQHVTQRCAAGEQLLGGSHAIGFFTAAPPPARLVRGVQSTQQLLPTAVRVGVLARGLRGARAVVQVSAICGGGR
jgi:hypothetical protein